MRPTAKSCANRPATWPPSSGLREVRRCQAAIFGSVVKGDAGPVGDVDVLYVLREGVHLGWTINDLADDLEEVPSRPVDLVNRRALHGQVKDAVLAEARVVYAA